MTKAAPGPSWPDAAPPRRMLQLCTGKYLINAAMGVTLMDERDTEHRHGTCVVCPVTRPDADPRQPNTPPVCDGDRALLDRWLVEIANLDADLRNDEPVIADERTHERYGTAYLPNGNRHVWSKGSYASDPVGALGGVAPINSKSSQPNVGGSRERPMPISTALHDLKAPARVPNPTAQGRECAGDQIGRLSAATTLDQWVRDWRDTLWPDHHLPSATVDQLVLWLRTPIGNDRTRLDVACDHHPAIDEFAAEMKDLVGALRSA
ncbi:MAG TPA: hypothetical protein VI172_05040, partial [Candidatus Dormibacteraeota bacterium]